MKPLGDPHNFGRRVALTDEGLYSKPRNLFWEWLFLASESPFRALIDEAAKRKSVISPFYQFPEVRFRSDSLISGGTVTNVKLTPLTKNQITPELCESIGSAIGLLSTMGIADLHRDNIGLGLNETGKIIFSPLDIESALETYSLPSQTHLLPSANVPPDVCGLAFLQKLITDTKDNSFVTAITHGYLNAVDLITENAESIASTLFTIKEFSAAPVRLFLRSTRQYYSWLNQSGESINPPLEKTEWEQLQRGDIPYFIRLLHSKEPLYFLTPDRTAPARLSAALTETGLANSVAFSDAQVPQLFTDHQKRSDLLKAGALQLLRFFDTKTANGTFLYSSTTCEFTHQDIFLISPDRLKVKCKRQ